MKIYFDYSGISSEETINYQRLQSSLKQGQSTLKVKY